MKNKIKNVEGNKMKNKMSVKDKARKAMGLEPVEKPKKDKVQRAPGEIIKRKSKYNIFGYPSSRVIHWAVKAGLELEEVRKALSKLCPETKEGISDINLRYRYNAGKDEKRCKPAPLDKNERKIFIRAARGNKIETK